MSTIFTRDTQLKPRPDARIRVEAFKPGTTEKAGWLYVDLLEFHPDFDERLKFRSYALVRTAEALMRPEHAHIYQLRGAGFLDEPYVEIREFFIHREDVSEMMDWSRRNDYRPLVIHPCPLPFPMFKKGQRVVVVPYKDIYDDTTDLVGEFATVAEESSEGGRTQISFEKKDLNKGYTSMSLPSLSLREAKTEA